MVMGMDATIDTTPTTIPQRVLDRVRARIASLVPDERGCLHWPSAFRYGVVGWREGGARRQEAAHRVAYMLAHGPVPPGLDVRHSCDRPSCVRADHLSIGTREQNMADCIERGRTQRGAAHHAAKLTAENVLDIVRRVEAGERRSDVARLYQIAPSQITAIMRGTTWSHVTGRQPPPEGGSDA